MSQTNVKPVRIVMLDDDPEDALLVSTAIKRLEYDVLIFLPQLQGKFTDHLLRHTISRFVYAHRPISF